MLLLRVNTNSTLKMSSWPLTVQFLDVKSRQDTADPSLEELKAGHVQHVRQMK